MHDDQTPRYENTPVGTMSSPDIIQGPGVEEEEILFGRFLPDLMRNNSPQDHDASNFDFSYPNIVETMNESMTLQMSHMQLLKSIE